MQSTHPRPIDEQLAPEFHSTGWMLDEILPVFRSAFDYLFPHQAEAVQTGPGAITISWSMRGDPHARFAHATPITIRFERDLIEALRMATPEQRHRILKRHEGTLRNGMLGYDPYATIPQARVIVLG